MPLYSYLDKHPTVADGCYIAPTAALIGDVTIEEGASVWFGAVLRGDVAPIRVGRNSNIQDGTVIHSDEGCPTVIGENVTVGHSAIIHAATVGDRVLVGMGAVLLSRSRVGSDTLIGARALVTEDTAVPGGSLLLGMPGKVRRALTDDEKAGILRSAAHYVAHARRYLTGQPAGDDEEGETTGHTGANRNK